MLLIVNNPIKGLVQQDLECSFLRQSKPEYWFYNDHSFKVNFLEKNNNN